MLNIKENISLKAFNTFGIDVKAKKYISLNKPEDVNDLLHSSILNSEEFLIIGEGSNLLFVKDYNGIIIHPKFKGINIHKKEDDFVFIEAYAGENWDTFVHYCTNNNYGGLENLSLIPGTVGASAIQNIGAYGMEAKDKIWQVCGFDLIEKKHKTFSNKECHFEYRNSIFKSEFKNRFIVTSVIYKLSTKNHNLNYHYGALQSVLNDCAEINIQNIRKAVIAIREQKLPDPEKLGNAGSFYKNPVVGQNIFKNIQAKYPNMPYYELADNMVKIPAAWLIDQCGFKGYKKGNVGVHENQALVLVNYNNGTGKEIIELSTEIKETVSEKFSIQLEEEVIIVGK